MEFKILVILYLTNNISIVQLFAKPRLHKLLQGRLSSKY